MSDDPTMVLKAAASAASGGAFARFALAFQGGERRPVVLIAEAVFGASLGLMAAAALVYLDNDLAVSNRDLLIIGGVSGLAGALGRDLLAVVLRVVQRKAR